MGHIYRTAFSHAWAHHTALLLSRVHTHSNKSIEPAADIPAV